MASWYSEYVWMQYPLGGYRHKIPLGFNSDRIAASDTGRIYIVTYHSRSPRATHMQQAEYAVLIHQYNKEPSKECMHASGKEMH